MLGIGTPQPPSFVVSIGRAMRPASTTVCATALACGVFPYCRLSLEEEDYHMPEVEVKPLEFEGFKSITEEELKAAGYEVQGYKPEGVFTRWRVLLNGEFLYTSAPRFIEKGMALAFARDHYAPRRLLAEVQARNAALEALVREAYGETCSGVYEDDVYDAMPAAWRERAAKLLEVGE